MKSRGITKIITVHPSKSCWGVSLWTKVVTNTIIPSTCFTPLLSSFTSYLHQYDTKIYLHKLEATSLAWDTKLNIRLPCVTAFARINFPKTLLAATACAKTAELRSSLVLLICWLILFRFDNYWVLKCFCWLGPIYCCSFLSGKSLAPWKTSNSQASWHLLMHLYQYQWAAHTVSCKKKGYFSFHTL